MFHRFFSLLLAVLLVWSGFATQEAPATTIAGASLWSQDANNLIDGHHVDDLPVHAQAPDLGETDQMADAAAKQPGSLATPRVRDVDAADIAATPPDPHRRPPKSLFISA